MKSFIVLSAVVLLAFACSEEKEEKSPSEVQPDASELALLMREIHVDAKNWRAALLDGKTVNDSLEVFTELVSSTPTKSEVKGPVFEGFAAGYQEKLNTFLNERDLNLSGEAFNNLVSACVSCHQTYCPGPIPTIEKLYLPAPAAASSKK